MKTITLRNGVTGLRHGDRQELQALRERLVKSEKRTNRLKAHNHRRSLIARGIIRTQEVAS